MHPSELAYRYEADLNPSGAHLPGVPLRDLSIADVASYPAWLQHSLARTHYYTDVRRPLLPRPSEIKTPEATPDA